MYLSIKKFVNAEVRQTIAENIQHEMDELVASDEIDDGGTMYKIGFISPGIRFSKFGAFNSVYVVSDEQDNYIELRLSPAHVVYTSIAFPLLLAAIGFLSHGSIKSALVPNILFFIFVSMVIYDSYRRVRTWIEEMID